ncbi:MAG: DUF3098 domain-containing protein [Bacteroidales bacterium]
MNTTTNKTVSNPPKVSSKTTGTQPKLFDFAFGKINYILMISGLIILAIGYMLMVGGEAKSFTEFNESLFDFRRLVLAPLILLIGFAVEIVAIMKRPKL